ncbi:MAG: hypothetical protein IJU37_01005 [Desulfovibrio sp.]|nr:hypothetical protein [Desulfovibrio sp.]
MPKARPAAPVSTAAQNTAAIRKPRNHQRNQARQSLLDAVLQPGTIQASAKSPQDPSPFLVLYARIPLQYWACGWLFKAIDDILWRSITSEARDTFPATLREDHTTHPGYVLRDIGNYGVELCPLTSRPKPGQRIPAGTRLQPTGFVLEKDSYPVFRAATVLPRKNGIFPKLPQFLGIFPPHELEA